MEIDTNIDNPVDKDMEAGAKKSALDKVMEESQLNYSQCAQRDDFKLPADVLDDDAEGLQQDDSQSGPRDDSIPSQLWATKRATKGRSLRLTTVRS